MALSPGDGPIRALLEQDELRAATKASVYAPYRPGLLTDLASALSAIGGTVSELRTYTSDDAMSSVVFWMQNNQGDPYEEGDFTRIREMLAAAAAGRENLAPPPRKSTASSVEIPVRVRVYNDASDLYTVVEVTARDRPGLLADLSRAIDEANVRIVSTIATTYGERAVDNFYIKDSFGLKLSSDSALRAVEQRLQAAAKAGVETAA